MNLQNETVLVVGAGRSGVAACRLLLQAGARPLLSDSKSRQELSAEALALEEQGVRLLCGPQLAQKVDWRLAVVSPGVPLMIPLLNQSRQAGAEVIGEIELAYRCSRTPFLGVTGTNGKTTTTALLGFILERAGFKVLVGGNIGSALAGEAAGFEGDYIVAELSSFQLDTCSSFRPRVGIYLNLSPDHLDRHGSLDNYAAAKEKLFARQGGEDFAVLNYDEPRIAAIAERIPSRKLWFSLESELADGAWFDGRAIRLSQAGRLRHSYDKDSIFIKGRHNMQNAMAAILAARAVGVDEELIGQALSAFPGVAHRLEFVCQRQGAVYINDSKGTNPDSTRQALLAYDYPQIILLGGYDKGADFSRLAPLVKERARLAILMGPTLPKLKQALMEVGFRDYLAADGFRHAVSLARQAARPGDTVLLSPACASWDEFDNFEQRGDLFKQLVRE